MVLQIIINELKSSYESSPTILVWSSLEFSRSITTFSSVFSPLTNTRSTIYPISRVSPQTYPRIAWTHHPSHHSAPKLTHPTYATHSSKRVFSQLTQSNRGIPTAPGTTPKSRKLPTDKTERVSFPNQNWKVLEIHQLKFKAHNERTC